MRRPEVGEKFSAEIDRISLSGNGIIETVNGHINVGPIEEEFVGERVKLKMVTSVFAICLTESAISEGYDSEFPWSSDDSGMRRGTGKYERMKKNELGIPIAHLPNKSENVITKLTIERTGIAGVPIAEYNGKPVHVPGAEVGERVNVEITKDKGSFLLAKVLNPSKSTTTARESEQETESRPEQKSTSSNLKELRRQAEEDAIETVPEEVKTSLPSEQYRRSQSVRKYVMTRSAGHCEACGEPAPFKSKTGKPYLHSHHIHELSDGGSDTPDTVAAICPNCHYRVHHGEDGDKYNQDLLNIVQELERDLSL